MIHLSDLELNVFQTNIAGMVMNLTMVESIKGNIKGSFVVKDNINFYDNFIGTTQAPITITFNYIGLICTNQFYIDGITNMKITKMGKTYTVNFISYLSAAMQLTNINEVFTGTSDNIINLLFRKSMGDEGKSKTFQLDIDTRAITKGKYVVPNIKAYEAISNVLNSAYDINGSCFCLYQRVFDQGITRLTSLYHMSKNYFAENPNLANGPAYRNQDRFKIKSAVLSASSEEESISPLSTIGTANDFTLREYNTNFASKLGNGLWGNRISHIQLDESKIANYETTEITDIAKVGYTTSRRLYENANTETVSHKYYIPNNMILYPNSYPNSPVFMNVDNSSWQKLTTDKERLVWIERKIPIAQTFLDNVIKYGGHSKTNVEYMEQLTLEKDRIINGEVSYVPTSLFSTDIDPVTRVAQHQKARLFNQKMQVANVVPVPYIGVGYTIEIEQGGSNLSSTRTDNEYIISNISHKFTLNDGEFSYSQDLGLIRE